jgi:hypothetical protein
MALDLSREEMALLCDALDTRRRELHSELVHTDDRALREDLKQMLAKLESLEDRLGRPRQL